MNQEKCRKKLIDLIKHCTSCEECRDEDIADHLLANGVIMPPVGVGDTVYLPVHYDRFFRPPTIWKIKIIGIDISSGEINRQHAVGLTESGGKYYFSLSEIGKTVFLTEEEAQKELRKRRTT